MPKLTKREKKQLKKQKKLGIFSVGDNPSEESEDKHPNFLESFLEKIPDIAIVFLAMLLSFLLYANTLNNQFTLVDDAQSFEYDERIHTIDSALKMMNLQKVIYSIFYHYFGVNPLPLRIMSVTLHMLVIVLGYLFVRRLFNKVTAAATVLVFAVHPVNTEAVSWISGNPYLFIAVIVFSVMNLYLSYKKTQKIRYLALCVLIFVMSLIFMQSPWMLIVPLALIILDQFLLEDKINFSGLWWLIFFAVPVGIYLLTYFTTAYEERQAVRLGNGDRTVLGAQAFTPVIEGYPYTVSMLSTLYVFPKTLTVYYDGDKITPFFYLRMYLIFFGFVGLILFFWGKNRKVAGLLIMLLTLVAPSMSPLKITWFIAERYLYAGTIFYGILLYFLFSYLMRKFPSARMYILALFIIYLTAGGIRTYTRNLDWQDTEKLSLSHMKAAPLSVRPYNDIGGYYYNKGEVKKAAEYYNKGLQVVPNSGTAITNLGFIYLKHGPLITWEEYKNSPPEIDESLAAEYYKNAILASDQGRDPRVLSFFINMSLYHNPYSVDVLAKAGDLYNKLGQNFYAQVLYKQALEYDPSNSYLLSVTESFTDLK